VGGRAISHPVPFGLGMLNPSLRHTLVAVRSLSVRIAPGAPIGRLGTTMCRPGCRSRTITSGRRETHEKHMDAPVLSLVHAPVLSPVHVSRFRGVASTIAPSQDRA